MNIIVYTFQGCRVSNRLPLHSLTLLLAGNLVKLSVRGNSDWTINVLRKLLAPMNKSTEALGSGNSVFEMEFQNPYAAAKRTQKVHIIAWDRQKTLAMATFAGCLLVWAAVFFPLLFYMENYPMPS